LVPVTLVFNIKYILFQKHYKYFTFLKVHPTERALYMRMCEPWMCEKQRRQGLRIKINIDSNFLDALRDLPAGSAVRWSLSASAPVSLFPFPHQPPTFSAPGVTHSAHELRIPSATPFSLGMWKRGRPRRMFIKYWFRFCTTARYRKNIHND